jgi:hypothetical protein
MKNYIAINFTITPTIVYDKLINDSAETWKMEAIFFQDNEKEINEYSLLKINLIIYESLR